jgi:hypothetical protein
VTKSAREKRGMKAREIRRRLKKRPFGYIAFWQMMVFGLLICLIWISEIWELPALYFGVAAGDASFVRGWVLSVAVVICALITVGNTYIQQKHIIQGLLVVCSTCGKIKIENNVWEEMQGYLTKHSLAALSHGMCPDCCRKITGEPSGGQAG